MVVEPIQLKYLLSFHNLMQSIVSMDQDKFLGE